jgi:DNA mismatch repair protein MutL
MAEIKLLSKEIAELIAAGEVIERPSSVIKELVENSIDSGATHITVEIKNGGSTYMRIVDDGCGIKFESVKVAFLRHATSKINTKEDLNNIISLGFRGEALASVCAVSRVEVLTKRLEDEMGTHYIIEGAEEKLHEKTGCPNGTTLIIRDLFYNVPARRKFLKKDVSEANMISSIVNKLALSHPEISFKMIRDNKLEFNTPGDGKLYSAIFSLFGKTFAHDLVEVDYEQDGIKVHGFCVKPLYAKSNRSFQNFFINDRYVKSMTCTVAIEEAYQGSIMTGKFPACILKIEIPPSIVDVNAHPAKTEVRFSDEKIIFNCIYFAIKTALMKSGLIYDFQINKETKSNNINIIEEEPKKEHIQMQIETFADIGEEKDNSKGFIFSSKTEPNLYKEKTKKSVSPIIDILDDEEEIKEAENIIYKEKNTIETSVHITEQVEIKENLIEKEEKTDPNVVNVISEEKKSVGTENLNVIKNEENIRYIGELFKGYILLEIDEKLVVMDKHAAHEKIIYEKLKSKNDISVQGLIIPSEMVLSLEEIDALQNNMETLLKMGFTIEFPKQHYVSVTSVPAFFSDLNIDEIISEIAQNLRLNKIKPNSDIFDDMLHSLACKAAIKINDNNSARELEFLARQVWADENIRHCPHGRPIIFTLTKKEIEKQFKRS